MVGRRAWHMPGSFLCLKDRTGIGHWLVEDRWELGLQKLAANR
jgi:hypothetical protein